jgi:uncharacterized membrane protein
MTEKQTPPTEATPAAGAEDVVVVAAQIADEHGVLAEGAVAAQGDRALIVGRFASTDLAIATYGGLLQREIDGVLDIDGVLVVKCDENGKMHVQKLTEHSTRNGLAWGIVGGVIAGIFLPASILAGAVALGIAGAAAGKARNLYRRAEIERELTNIITPGTSGILALVSAVDAEAAAKAMPDAQEVKTIPVDQETAEAVKEAAAAAGDSSAAQETTKEG